MTAYVRSHCTDAKGTRFWRYAHPRPSDGAWVMTSGWQQDTSKGTDVRSIDSDHQEHGTGTAGDARAFVEALIVEHPGVHITVEGSDSPPPETPS